jgi:hypothetical protein
MVIEIDDVDTDPAELDAVTVNADVPAAVGVPPRTPADVNVNPAGNEPVPTANVGAGVPLATNTYPAKALPTTPEVGGVETVNTGATVGTLMVIEIDDVDTDPAELDAVTVNADVPAAVGVPPRTPADVNVNPAGNEPVPTAKVGAGVPLATNTYPA